MPTSKSAMKTTSNGTITDWKLRPNVSLNVLLHRLDSRNLKYNCKKNENPKAPIESNQIPQPTIVVTKAVEEIVAGANAEETVPMKTKTVKLATTLNSNIEEGKKRRIQPPTLNPLSPVVSLPNVKSNEIPNEQPSENSVRKLTRKPGPKSRKHSQSSYTCHQCLEALPSKCLLLVHQLVHATDKNPIKCEYCQERFATLYELKDHILDILTHKATEEKETCEICKKWCRHSYTLHIHMRTHPVLTPKSDFKCKLCQKRFPDLNELEDHLAIHIAAKLKRKEVIVLDDLSNESQTITPGTEPLVGNVIQSGTPQINLGIPVTNAENSGAATASVEIQTDVTISQSNPGEIEIPVPRSKQRKRKGISNTNQEEWWSQYCQSQTTNPILKQNPKKPRTRKGNNKTTKLVVPTIPVSNICTSNTSGISQSRHSVIPAVTSLKAFLNRKQSFQFQTDAGPLIDPQNSRYAAQPIQTFEPWPLTTNFQQQNPSPTAHYCGGVTTYCNPSTHNWRQLPGANTKELMSDTSETMITPYHPPINLNQNQEYGAQGQILMGETSHNISGNVNWSTSILPPPPYYQQQDIVGGQGGFGTIVTNSNVVQTQYMNYIV